MKAVGGGVVSRTKQDRCRHDDADDGNIWTLALPNTSTLPERAQQSVQAFIQSLLQVKSKNLYLKNMPNIVK